MSASLTAYVAATSLTCATAGCMASVWKAPATSRERTGLRRWTSGERVELFAGSANTSWLGPLLLASARPRAVAALVDLLLIATGHGNTVLSVPLRRPTPSRCRAAATSVIASVAVRTQPTRQNTIHQRCGWLPQQACREAVSAAQVQRLPDCWAMRVSRMRSASHTSFPRRGGRIQYRHRGFRVALGRWINNQGQAFRPLTPWLGRR